MRVGFELVLLALIAGCGGMLLASPEGRSSSDTSASIEGASPSGASAAADAAREADVLGSAWGSGPHDLWGMGRRNWILHHS
jgi:hypothetical protein